jgi:isoleucyl-tRNA synthetase
VSGRKEGSVFEETWVPLPAHGLDAGALAAWGELRQVRELVSKKIEEKRERKELGSSLQAELEIRAHGAPLAAMQALGEDLKFVFIVSDVKVVDDKGAPLQVHVKASAHAKCGRCWHYRADVNAEGLCGRCESNLHGAGEARRHA